MAFTKKRILITVKTSPNPSKKYQETVCVAGVLLDDPPSWVRLYPIPFRDLPYDQQFSKYQVLEADIQSNSQDPRPESHKILPESIKIIETIGTKGNWRRRKEYLLPLKNQSMCEIQKSMVETGKSLGMFKPLQVQDFIVEERKEKEWTPSQKQILSQTDLFKKDKAVLEKIPYKFSIKYICSDPNCKGHNQGIIDWETAELYRKLIRNFDEIQVIKKIKEKYLNEVCRSDKDLFFIVGNQKEAKLSFLILSIFWPPKDIQANLF